MFSFCGGVGKGNEGNISQDISLGRQVATFILSTFFFVRLLSNVFCEGWFVFTSIVTVKTVVSRHCKEWCVDGSPRALLFER